MITKMAHAVHNVRERYVIIAAILSIPNLCCLYAAWPGFIQADHQATITGIVTGEPSQWHSLMWGYLAVPFMYFTPSYGFYGFVQIACFVAAVTFSLYRLERLGLLSGKACMIAAVLFALCPTFLMYNLLYSSDLMFAYALLALTVMLVELCMTRGEVLGRRWFVVSFGLLLLFAFELRKNAALVIVFVFIALMIRYTAMRVRIVSLFAAIAAAIVALNLLFGVALQAQPSPSQEMLSVPAQQIARAVRDDGDIPQSAAAVIDTVRSREDWKNLYDPITADPVKGGTALTSDFVKAWFEIGIRNPRSYVHAYLDMMYPFWQLTPDAGNIMIGIDFSNHDELTIGTCRNACRSGYVEQFSTKQTGAQGFFSGIYYRIAGMRLPLVADIMNFVFFNRALPLWTMVIGLCVAARRRKTNDYMTVTIPLYATLLSLLCFAPVPMFRYSLQMYYLLPAVLLYLRRVTVGRAESSLVAQTLQQGEPV
ncbi:DUF6020 family protein [Bifidobacterium simiiventris]|uniref:DUF6020 family protein n=1 Tax=Bifidobacterium simiiventris TaxID=2834434 RepID=UPI001C588609|nr:DUF6020 family protein [Bifidobacterium simiiventris]MBW3079654.1 hypothetical protein [Bifidobacterium simiiventris]